MRITFGELLPPNAQSLKATGADRESVAQNIELAYTKVQLCGCYLTTHDGDLGRAARWMRDKFRDVAGGRSQFEEVYDSIAPMAGTEGGYLSSIDAFATWKPAPDAVDWLFQFVQDSGDCVGASGVKLLQGLMGTRAADPANREAFRYLPAMWTYAFRGACGSGWFMGAHAAEILEHGYAFALPDFCGVNYDHEDDSESYTVSKWCSAGPAQKFRDFVNAKGWKFEEGAITEFGGGVDAIKRVVQAKGQIHHGSVYTSGSSKPSCPNSNRLTRCGGHAQTMFGAFWDEKTLTFFNDMGFKFTPDDFPCVNHQTWGNWSGGVDPKYWPSWWGPKPEGAWICSANQMLDRFLGEAYVYLPRCKGWPDDSPGPVVPPAPQPCAITVTGRLTTDVPTAIRGRITAQAGDQSAEFIFVPDADGYVPVRKQN